MLVLDNRTDKVLLSRNAGQSHSIASLTKLQAALVFLDRGLKLEQGTVINRDDWKVALDGCRTRLELKWTYRNLDLLHAALMSSDNRAVSALARATGLQVQRPGPGHERAGPPGRAQADALHRARSASSPAT